MALFLASLGGLAFVNRDWKQSVLRVIRIQREQSGLYRYLSIMYPNWKLANCAIRCKEAGRGGDSLFHSIAGAMEHLCRQNKEARRLYERCLGSQIWHGTRKEAVQCLRGIAASGFLDEKIVPHETFLDHLLTQVHLQNMGSFLDHWSKTPRDLIQEYGFSCLEYAETVEAVSADPNGDRGDMILVVRQTGCFETHQIAQGESGLLAMRRFVDKEIRRCGHVHWGDQLDCRVLSEKLNIGLFIFTDNLLDNKTLCLYPLGARRGNFPFWISIGLQDTMQLFNPGCHFPIV